MRKSFEVRKRDGRKGVEKGHSETLRIKMKSKGGKRDIFGWAGVGNTRHKKGKKGSIPCDISIPIKYGGGNRLFRGKLRGGKRIHSKSEPTSKREGIDAVTR